MKEFRAFAAVSITAALVSCSDVTQPTETVPTLGLARGSEKVAVCHNGNTITIAKPALPAHLAHGDALPSDGGDGPVSWWPLDETSGTTATDVADGNDATHVNGPTPIAGQVGGALDFDGVDDRLQGPADGAGSNLDITGPFTLAAWVYPTAVLGTAGNAPIVAKWGDTFFGTAGYGLFMDPAGFVRLLVSSSGLNVFGNATPVGFGHWTHVVGMYTGSLLQVYVNGVRVSQQGHGGSIHANDVPVMIGSYNFPTFTHITGFLDGTIDEVQIFDRALSPLEITALFETGSAGSCQ